MPRETARLSARQEAPRSRFDTEIAHTGRTVRVSLSGILDDDGVTDLAARVQPRLSGRGMRIVLDGRGLAHLDYRAIPGLIAWYRRLRGYGHELYLHGWSDYLKAILVMEDWEGELGGSSAGLPTLRHLGSLAAVRTP
jgi:anti-anti-sigma regulatory factor